MFTIKKRLLSVSIATGLAAILAGTGHATTIAYEVPAMKAGNQDWTGSLGMDFDVNSTINVTHLGVFDSLSDGISGTLAVQIFDRTTMIGINPILIFTGTSDTLSGGSRFQALNTPLMLMAGFEGSIVSWGYSSSDQNYNAGFNAGLTSSTTNDGGGLISFVGMSRFSASGTGGTWPNMVDSGPVNRYDAGTFMFEAKAVPEPGTLALFGLGLASLAVARRRKAA